MYVYVIVIPLQNHSLAFFRCRDYTEKNKATNYHVRMLFVIIAIVVTIAI